MLKDITSRGNYVFLTKLDDKVERITYRPSKFDGRISSGREYTILNDLELDYSNTRDLYFDIETDDSEGHTEVGESRVLSFAGIDNKDNEFIYATFDEEELLERVKELFSNYDILIGYYSDSFDYPYLRRRGKKYGIDFRHDERRHIDFYKALQNTRYLKVLMNEANLPDRSLNSLGEVLLGLEKVELELPKDGSSVIKWYFENDRGKLKEYNLRDCKILKRLEEEYRIVETLKFLAEYVGVPIYDVKHNISPAVESIILRELLDREDNGESFSRYWNKLTRYSDKRITSSYKGALVRLLKPGLYEDVLLLDFKSLYPNIMRTFNISFDTLTEKDRDNTLDFGGMGYRQDYDGVMRTISDRLIKKRNEYRSRHNKTASTSMKLLSNASYGYLGSPYLTFKNPLVAKTITRLARRLEAFLINYYSNTSTPVIYCDTDSLFMENVQLENCDRVTREVNEVLKDYIESRWNITERNTLELEFEMHFSKILFQAKKHYVGMTDRVGDELVEERYARGLELAKSDYTIFTKELLSGLVDMIFNDGTLGEIVDYILDKKRELYSGKVTLEKMAIQTSMHKKREDYEQLPLHARIAYREAEEDGREYLLSRKISYIITGFDGKLKGVSLEKAKQDEISYSPEEYWHRRIWKAIRRFTDILYPGRDLSNLKTGWKLIEQENLESWA